MWLLDVNLPIALTTTLKDLGVAAQTTESRGWRELENGKLVSVASAAGFKAILTRDHEFGFSAAKAMKEFPQFAVVIMKLPQRKEKFYISRFIEEWTKSPIAPLPGRVFLGPKEL